MTTTIQKLRPFSATLLAVGGTILMLLGFYFAFLRPPLLPEDLRSMSTSLAQVHATIPGFQVWLRRVFWVMGGYMFTTGLLTVYIARTAFRARVRGAAGVTTIAGLTSTGLMAAVNFVIASDFKWLILSFVIPWILALGLYWTEQHDS